MSGNRDTYAAVCAYGGPEEVGLAHPKGLTSGVNTGAPVSGPEALSELESLPEPLSDDIVHSATPPVRAAYFLSSLLQLYS